jgi:hypothetical protein
MKEPSKVLFESIHKWNDEFLPLFPHQFDYIWAEYPDPSAQVDWKTESRHPLVDPLIQRGAYLYGVRFGAETNYFLIDIDTGSTYHSKHDLLAISRITTALEPLELVRYIVFTSSYSKSLHLYFPFQQAQSSWQLATALTCLLENAGFKICPGQLEVFPNSKPYSTDGTLSLFNARHLPLQIGSYLLDPAFQPIWSDTHAFVKQWQLIQQHNDIDSKTLKQILKQAKRKHFGISGKAEKCVNDLNAEIELGWTGYGQTNRLLGRIIMRSYIFHHTLSGGEPLEGRTLVSEVVEIARSLPGYQEWCCHQHEIEHRAEEWARCIENSPYFHFGDQSKKQQPEVQDPDLTATIDQSLSWNQRQSAATRDHIRHAIANLLNLDSLPVRASARFQALLKFGIGGASLYRHRDLWHPSYFDMDSNEDLTHEFHSSAENSPYPSSIKMDGQLEAILTLSNWLSPPRLLDMNGGSNPVGKAFSDPMSNRTSPHPDSTGSNFSVTSNDPDSALDSLDSVQYVQRVLFNIQAQQEAFQAAARIAQTYRQYIKSQVAQRWQITQMQQFLTAGDPILIAEAMAWAQVNPRVNDTS